MVLPGARDVIRRNLWYLTALVTPLALWLALAAVPALDIEFLATTFHLVLMTMVSLCALGVAIVAARASTQVRQPGVVLLATGCIAVGLFLLGHGLTTPGVLGQPFNQWVSRFPYVGIGLFTMCLALAASPSARVRLRFAGERPLAWLLTSAVPLAAFVVFVSWRPTAFSGTQPLPGEEGVRLAIAIGVCLVLLPVSWVHWRRFRLGLDIVQASLAIAAAMTVAATLSMHFGELWRLSWWDYHGCLLAGFAGVAYGVFKRWGATKWAAEVLEDAFEDDPLTVIAHNYPTPLRRLVGAMEDKDPYTYGHSARTAELAVAIGARMGLGGDALRTLAQGAYLHDIGKLGIPGEILNKPGPLTEQERTVIETHPRLGVIITSSHRELLECIPVILHHHERFDGTGYPDHLAAGNIPLLARIAAVADVWDALTSDRSYRPGWQPEKALDHIVEGAGQHLDQRVVAVLLDIAAEAGIHPFGVGGDLAALSAATSDCHEAGPGHGDLTDGVHRLVVGPRSRV